MATSAQRLSKTTARALLWRRGELSWKLQPHQPVLYDAIKGAISNPDLLKYVINCSRRFGKSYVLCIVAIEFAIQRPGVQVRFAAPTAKMLRNIVLSAFKKILADCPEDIKPVWRVVDGIYRFPNGSEIYLAGADNGNAERLRGTASDLNIVDEGGFVSELTYLLDDVLIPQTLTTGGKTLISSTPPKTPAHPFFLVAQEAIQRGNYILLDIFQNTSIDQKTRDQYAAEAGGYDSTTFQREYRCMFVTDKEAQIIPEFKDSMIVDVPADEYFKYYKKYESLDLGVRDSTVALFGFYDFKNARLVIQDEFALQGAEVTTSKIAELVRNKESELWTGNHSISRISDSNDLIFTQSIGLEHGLHFIPTSKDSLHAMINKVRQWVQDGRVAVSPRCTQLIGCLKYGVWTEDRKQFARSKVYGHFDALAALNYMVRNVDESTNPISITHGHQTTYGMILNNQSEASSSAAALNSIFTNGSRKSRY